jgi:hypothetical protein
VPWIDRGTTFLQCEYIFSREILAFSGIFLIFLEFFIIFKLLNCSELRGVTKVVSWWGGTRTRHRGKVPNGQAKAKYAK